MPTLPGFIWWWPWEYIYFDKASEIFFYQIQSGVQRMSAMLQRVSSPPLSTLSDTVCPFFVKVFSCSVLHVFFYFDDLKLPRLLTYNFIEWQILLLSKEHFVWIETLQHFYWKKVKVEGGGLDFIHISSSSLSLFWTQHSSDIIRGQGGCCMLSGAVRKSWRESDCEHHTCSCELKEKTVSASEMRPRPAVGNLIIS